MTFRAMTWNIHSAIGPDGRYDLGRVIRRIQAHQPDLLALQEVESRGRGERPSPFEELRAFFEGHALAAETMTAHDGAYGHMLLSRWPMRRERLVDLSLTGREPRIAISALVDAPRGPLHVIAVHLGLKAWERREQAVRLADLIRDSREPVLVMGDLNDWAWRGPVWRRLAPLLPGRTAVRTFPARLPLLRLDRILCRPAAMLGRSWRDIRAATASDHLPVIAEIIQPPQAGEGDDRGQVLARPEGLEPPTNRVEAGCSVQLS